jgi:hypothetical protein
MWLNSLDELIFDYLIFVMQEVKWRDKQLVSSRKPMLMFVILVTFVHCLFKSEPIGAT